MSAEIFVHTYGPPLIAGDERPEHAAQAIERALPGESLSFTINDAAERVPISDRAEWLAHAASQGMIPIVCNQGYEGSYIALTGVTWKDVIAPAGKDMFSGLCRTPRAPFVLERVEAVLSELAAALDAYWGAAVSAAGLYYDQVIVAGASTTPPFGLPALREPREIESPLVPLYFGWVNYWSPGTVKRLGFPTTPDDPGPFARVRPLASGAWILWITEDPLDPSRPEHLAALLAAYDRLPAVGGRDVPLRREPEFVPVSKSVQIESYAPPLVPEDERPEQAARAIETALPGVALAFTSAENDDDLMVELADRAAWLRKAASEKQATPTIFDEEEELKLWGANVDQIVAPGLEAVLCAGCELPPTPAVYECIEDLGAALGHALGAFWLAVDAPAANGLSHAQIARPWNPPPPFGLPALRSQYELESALVPWRLGWINYWSAETAKRVGFSAGGSERGPFARVRAVAGGAWLLRLTEEPFDPARPEHHAALITAYERFPAVGGRDRT